MTLRESAENYLETILRLQEQTGAVHSVDVAHETGFSRPSVSRAVGLLRDNGYLSIADNGCLTLTEAGLAAARRVIDRHAAIFQLLQRLGVSAASAEADACRIEHVISDESYRQILRFLAQEKE